MLLRILMYVARPSDAPYTIAEIAQDLYVSQKSSREGCPFYG